MATYIYLDPTNEFLDALTWNTAVYTGISKTTREPTAPSTGTFIRANASDDNELQGYVYEPPSVANGGAVSGTVNRVRFYYYSEKTATAPDPTADLFFDGVFHGSSASGTTGTVGWHSLEYSGTWDVATEFEDVISSMTTGTMPASQTVTVYQKYVELRLTETITETVSGGSVGGGTATVFASTYQTISGGSVGGGTAVFTYNETPDGGVILNGIAKFAYTESGDGGVEINGTASVSDNETGGATTRYIQYKLSAWQASSQWKRKWVWGYLP